MKKIMLTGMLVASFSLFANDLNNQSNSKQKEETSTEKTILVKKEGSAFFYLHCRIKRDSRGVRSYEWCRNEVRRDGVTVILNYLSPENYPPLPPPPSIEGPQ